MTAIDEVLVKNARFAADFDEANCHAQPARRLEIVACMDARLDSFRALGLAPGDAHVIRNAGGVVTDDVIRSLVISQRLLGTREIMLIHHSDCGMTTISDDELKDAVETETGLRPPFEFQAFSNLEQDILDSITRIQANPFIPHRDRIRGFICDCATVRLTEVAPA